MRRERVFDAYLVAATRAGDERASRLLIECWHPRLVAHAARLMGRGDRARDIAQEAWIDIARGLGGLRDDRAFPAWAYRIVSRKCAAAIRDARRERGLETALAAEPSVQRADPAFDRLDATQRLRAAIQTLPAEQRAAIALFHFEEMSVAEVAVALDVPTGTVKTRLMHARRKLRAVLEGDE